MKLVLVRHGGREEDHAVRLHDPPLRARETAEPRADRLGLAADTLDAWAEPDRRLAVCLESEA